MLPACLTDAEIDAICDGLRQNAARIRYLRSLALPVTVKPNGRPLVRRSDWERTQNSRTTGPRWTT